MPSLIWFRNDLRTSDNPALRAAAAHGEPAAGLYLLEGDNRNLRPLGGAAHWKLHGALCALRQELKTLNIPLILLAGDPEIVVPDVAARIGATGVFWNRRYAPQEVACDKAVKTALAEAGRGPESFNGSLLVEPWQVQTGSGGRYKVFTPFCKAARGRHADLAPKPTPDAFPEWKQSPDLGEPLDNWRLKPTQPNWAQGMEAVWEHGGAGATRRLQAFLDDGFKGYADGRDLPATNHCSGISPHLRFGEISPRQARAAALSAAESAGGSLDRDFETFERELYWRDFSQNLLHYSDDLAAENYQQKFDAFPWRDCAADLKAWQTGRTGYPIVDAGMRQLWTTGWMHNRVRMIVASFLTKHLMIDWRAGERWFWDTLVDADIASNPANWQWVAGSGADAAPYFRIFNPMTQGKKFDPDGAYVRQWIPELARLPNKHLQTPWEAPDQVLKTAEVTLGKDYPAPIVDHKAARERALEAFKSI